MGLNHRDNRRPPDDSRPGRGSGRTTSKWCLDYSIAVGVAIVGVVLLGLVMRGFDEKPSGEYDPMGIYEAYYDADLIQIDVNNASREELLLIPMMSDRIADGLIKARPFKLSEELLNVKGVGEINMEIMLMYLYGFEDSPDRYDLTPPGVPDV